MSTPELRKVLCPSNPNPNIALTSESLVETILNPSSPFKTMPLESTKEGVDCTVQDAWKLEAQFAKISKRNSRSKSRSKWDADCPRETPIEAATGDGKLEVVGPTADDMITLQYAIKIEPGLEPQDGFRIDDVKPAELNITPPSASDSEPNSTTFIPTVKIEIEKQLADVVDVKEEVREIVLEKKKAARVKGPLMLKCTILTSLHQVRCTLGGRTGLTLTGDKIEDLVDFLDRVAGSEGGVKREVLRRD